MMNRVQNRHEDLNAHYANHGKTPAVHHRIKQDLNNIPIQTKNFQQYYNRLQALSESPVETNNQDALRPAGSGWSTERQRLQEKERLKQRRMAKKAKCTMIKQKAHGNEHIALESRQYFVVHFDPMPTENKHGHQTAGNHVFLFVNESNILGEVLQFLKNHYTRNILLDAECPQQKSINLVDLCVVVKTADSPDWRVWNRNAPVKDLFDNFEDIWVSYMPTSIAMQAQDHIDGILVEQRRILQQLTSSDAAGHTETVPVSATTKEKVENNPSTAQTAANHSYSKGDQAWYYKTPYVEDAEPLVLGSVEEANQHNIPLLLVKIIGVHHDDFPNIYYTISMTQPPHGVGLDSQKLVFHSEKQTDRSHLIPYVLSTNPEPQHNEQTHNRSDQPMHHLQSQIESLGHIITIRASHGKQEFSEIRVSLLCTVAQLKQLLSFHCHVPSNKMKLIFKGAMLKPDGAVLHDLKIPQNAKITIMG
jgi:hypothetical protein